MKKFGFLKSEEPLDIDASVPDNSESKASSNRNKRLVIGIAAAVLVLALGFFLPALLDAAFPPDEAQNAAVSGQAQVPLSMPATSSGLTASVNAVDSKETAQQSDISVEFKNYCLALSSVPGMPFIITTHHEDLEADSIRVDVDAGRILSWTPPDYSAKKRGKTYVLSSGDTIYWSPFDKQSTPVDNCELTVTVYDSNGQAYTVSVAISQTKDFFYTAEIIK